MSTHTIQTEVEVEVAEINRDCAYPIIEIEYDYERGYTPRIPRGEYGPIDPPTGTIVSLRAAKVINADALDPEPVRVQQWAEQFLKSDAGRNYACDCAETDLLAMRAAHLEGSRDQ